MGDATFSGINKLHVTDGLSFNRKTWSAVSRPLLLEFIWIPKLLKHFGYTIWKGESVESL